MPAEDSLFSLVAKVVGMSCLACDEGEDEHDRFKILRSFVLKKICFSQYEQAIGSNHCHALALLSLLNNYREPVFFSATTFMHFSHLRHVSMYGYSLPRNI